MKKRFNATRASLAFLLFYLFVSLVSIFPVAQAKTTTPQTQAESSYHPLTVAETVEIIKDSFQKAQFFNILEYQENGQIYVEASYARLELRDPTRYLGSKDQSRLYTLNVYVTPNPQDSKQVGTRIKVKNEGVFGQKFNQTLQEKFNTEFQKRLKAVEQFRQTDPASIAQRYLAGEPLAQEYGYTTLKLLNLEYKPPGTWENYNRALLFLQNECAAEKNCQTAIQDLLSQETFWQEVETVSATQPQILDELGPLVSKDTPNYHKYLTLLNQSAEKPLTSLEEEAAAFLMTDLPEEWKSKGVGSEKARGLEYKIALKTYEELKRSMAFDVDTEEVLMIRRIASKLFPYALRKGLDYNLHIYDDTKPGTLKWSKNNAFTSGGGILYISRSLIQKIDPQDEATIAAVVAHELGHNDAYHLQRRIVNREVFDAALQLSSFGDLFLPGVSYLTYEAGRLVNSQLSRNNEYEADRLGLYLLYKAGYDPAAMERAFEAFTKLQKGRVITLPHDSHPNPYARLRRIKHLSSDRELLEKTTLNNAAEDFLGEK
jgi:Zn-dependent protease with chaperone function